MRRNAPALSLALVLSVVSCLTSISGPMSQVSLAKNIEEIAGETKISPNVVEFEFDGVAIACVSDATHLGAYRLAVHAVTHQAVVHRLRHRNARRPLH